MPDKPLNMTMDELLELAVKPPLPKDLKIELEEIICCWPRVCLNTVKINNQEYVVTKLERERYTITLEKG